MKTLILSLFCFTVCFNLNGQIITCDPYTTNFTDVECIDGNILFTVTSNNPNSFTLFEVPAGAVVNSPDLFSLSGNVFTVYNGTFFVNMPSPGCLPLNFPYFAYDGNTTFCTGNLIIQGAPVAPIPTLSQWMIATLAFMVTIFGVLGIRSSLSRKVEA
jgi:hypothetical protein